MVLRTFLRPAFFSAMILGIWLGSASSEVPDWGDLRHQLVMTRHHWYGDPKGGTRFTGIWGFDPETGALTRLRGYTQTYQWLGMIPRDNSGYGHVLATTGDRLVVQMWPHNIEFEVPSWRLLRRYPPTADFSLEGPGGWAVQGPIVSKPAALSLGLDPGIYGFATCVYHLTTRGPESGWRYCEPYQYPGWESALDRGGDYSVLLHRPMEPLVAEVSFAADVTPHEYHHRNVPALSFDRERSGFWRAGPQTVEFLPVANGAVQPASVVHELDFPSLDNWEVFALHLHLPTRRFFGVAEDADFRDWVFFGLDEDLSLFATYDLPHTEEVGWPISITSFDELPESHVQTLPVASRTTRTYTTRPDGGTYGGMLPLYPPNGWPVQHFAGIEIGSGFRVNVGLFNGDHDHAMTHRLTLYRADGTEVTTVEFDLAPLELKQQSLARILNLPAGSLEAGTYGLTVLPLDDDEKGIQGRSWAFVSLVDNITGDPTNWW